MKREELAKIRLTFLNSDDEKSEIIRKLLNHIDKLEATLEDPLLPLFYPPPRFPKINFGTCDRCAEAEWRDKDYDYNLSEGYWWCNKYSNSLNSTWNDYGCNKCEECINAEEKSI